MLITLFTLAVPLLASFYGVSAQYIDPPTNPHSTIETFSFGQSMDRAQSLNVTDSKNTTVMTINTTLKNADAIHYAMDLTLLPSQERLQVKINVSPELILLD
jgi:YbbR domain-containing protein